MADQAENTSKSSYSALVIDDDQVIRNMLGNYLRRFGFATVAAEEDGEAAWQTIKKQSFDFIVLDWKLPRLSGLALYNRIRSLKNYRTVPILVVSGFVEKEDFRLLQEFPCTSFLEKPVTESLFQNRVEELQREYEWYAQNVTLMDSLLSALNDSGRKAESVLKDILKKAPNPVPLAVLASRRLIRAGQVATAEQVLREILKIDDACVMAINELGKILHLRGRHVEALDLLRMAQRLSPQNIQRLCLLGEVELNLREPEQAQAYFKKALELDDDVEKAKSGLVVADNMTELLAAPQSQQTPKAFASLLNTMGITLVRTGDFSRGIEQYQAALAFLHEKRASASVAFNLGLGFLRWGKPQQALPWFEKAAKLSAGGRSAGYVRKLQLIYQNSGVLTATADVASAAISHSETPVPVPRPGPILKETPTIVTEKTKADASPELGNQNSKLAEKRENGESGASIDAAKHEAPSAAANPGPNPEDVDIDDIDIETDGNTAVAL